MVVTNVKDLKARLNHYLRLAEDGKTVLVTRRGRVVAEVRRPQKRRTRTPSVSDVMRGLAEQGLVDLPRRTGPVGLEPPVRLRNPKAARRILEELMGERKRR